MEEATTALHELDAELRKRSCAAACERLEVCVAINDLRLERPHAVYRREPYEHTALTASFSTRRGDKRDAGVLVACVPYRRIVATTAKDVHHDIAPGTFCRLFVATDCETTAATARHVKSHRSRPYSRALERESLQPPSAAVNE